MLELLLPDHSRLALGDSVTIGRAAESTVRLVDPSVSRLHARVRADTTGAVLEDAGSSYGTWLDGERLDGPARLYAGARIRIGNQELLVDRARGEDEAGPTILVEGGAAADHIAARPRRRAGYALKRLAAGEAPRRWVLKDLYSGRLVRLSDADAELFGLFDGTRTVADLAAAAERRLGPYGPARLALLLASLGERGFLEEPGEPADERPESRLRRAVRPRQIAWAGAGGLFARLYAGGGRLLVGPRARLPLAAVCVAGIAAFAYLVLGRYGTPFVVASKVGLGGAVFVLGRLAIAAVHETAHGLVMASFGRRVRAAGLKVVLVFPYVYVDTSDVWFEPRRHRIAVSAAGPVSDLSLGAAFAVLSLAVGAGTFRDVLFQLAFGAYVGAFFNLNPLLDRDGYHILVDVLGRPGLRRRARTELRRRLAGGPRGADSRVLMGYSLLGLAWSGVGGVLAVALSLRYAPELAARVPAAIAWPLLCVVWLASFMPVLAAVGPGLLERLHSRRSSRDR